MKVAVGRPTSGSCRDRGTVGEWNLKGVWSKTNGARVNHNGDGLKTGRLKTGGRRASTVNAGFLSGQGGETAVSSSGVLVA